MHAGTDYTITVAKCLSTSACASLLSPLELLESQLGHQSPSFSSRALGVNEAVHGNRSQFQRLFPWPARNATGTREAIERVRRGRDIAIGADSACAIQFLHKSIANADAATMRQAGAIYFKNYIKKYYPLYEGIINFVAGHADMLCH